MKILIKLVLSIVLIASVDELFSYMPNQVQAFLKAIKNPNQIANCANCDFRGVQDLAGIDAHTAFLPGATFQPCIASDANKNSFMVCTADQIANLMGINLAGVNLFSACLDGAMLDNADLTGVNLTNASARYTSFKNAKIAGMITTNATFCNAIMPDGALCTNSWTGQGITINCNCSAQDAAKSSQMAAVQTSTSSQQVTTAPQAPQESVSQDS